MIFRLDELRRQRDLSQAELSRKSGVTRQTIIKMEHNDCPMVNVKTLLALASALSCEPADLFLPQMFSENNTREA